MGWTVPATALPTDKPATPGVVVTSTSTLVVPEGGSHRLRMFGVDNNQLAKALQEPDPTLLQTAEPSVMPVGTTDGDKLTMAWLQSEAIPVGSPRESFVFPTYSVTDRYLHSTVIPARKADMVWEGQTFLQPTYKDVHVLELRGGLGYLMVASRYASTTEVFGPVTGIPGGKSPGQQDSSAAILGWWSADAAFDSPDVRGPVFLVSRVQNVDGTPAFVWLGVPAAVEVDEGGVKMVYLYYTAESSNYLPPPGVPEPSRATFVSGTRLRTVRLQDLLNAFGVEVPVESPIDLAAAGVGWHPNGPDLTKLIVEPPRFIPRGLEPESAQLKGAAVFNESLWSAAGVGLVPGTDRGKVRIWVATGDVWQTGDGDLTATTRGNTLLWDYCNEIKDVDAVPVWAGWQLCLYVAANQDKDRAKTPLVGYGIWRAAAIPGNVTDDFGIDMVVFPFDRATWVEGAEGERDIVAVSEAADTGYALRLDPDPLQLPTSAADWLVCSGGGVMVLNAVYGDDATAAAPWTDAWT